MTQSGAQNKGRGRPHRRAWLFGLAGGALGFLGAFAIWGISDGKVNTEAADQAPAHRGTADIAPTDFAILPCPRAGTRGECAVIAAGGKRVLVGAPAGISAPPDWATGALGASGVPDAILLLSLDAAQIEGLDEIRNQVWEQGLSPLPLVGGAGISEINAGLDQTYIVPDAVAYVRRRRRKSFAQMPLAVRAVRHEETAFDTGDLTISALAGGEGQLAYKILYGGQTVILSGCHPRPEDIARWPEADHYVGCAQVASDHALPATGDWPLSEPIFISQSPAEPAP